VAQELEKEFALKPRGTVDLKGKGSMETYFLWDRITSRHPGHRSR
jgi:hypothetical protein